MSDGKAKFPDSAVDLHKLNTTFKDKIEFYSVAFGRRANINILTQIANEMPNGKVV